mmetsp:Transcript_5946/g.15802  ORF Transcript_5946/g.15802 Transcript_5946/m.15802 type:complete len:259 (-) Transcript_5946:164-940(-)|eukprot:CAMPEP_0202393890 /NCGR_PEP_ID=MMETSP1127-20130417/93142_1 /ASSEMBLY_ACC=CAM_ASM_000462 /TAXON_ID=3047 /ORGANISM="Dunaliella tertiolecta, Strain CCMP1320" /LENGTH=258 /DNA_ID=CAMNT_0048996485 /DNA_START=1396 /DNA_END=2172 /DNA_ORIENTATION=-
MHVSRSLSRTLPISRRPARSLAPLPRPTPPPSYVVFSSQRQGDDEPSWKDIANSAGNLLKTTFNKVKNSAASLLAPKKEQPPPEPPLRRRQEQLQQEQLRQRDLQRQGLTRVPGADDLLPGLFGRAAGSLLSGAFDMLGSELAKSSKERETVLDEARRRISNSPAVKQRLGNVQVLEPTSQSSSTMSINGRSTQRINLITPIQGSSGALAFGQVEYASEGGKRSSCIINVQMPEGDMVRIDEVDASGQTIDVDFREIR